MKWPETLPQRLEMSGNTGSFGVGGIRSDMEHGPVFQEPRHTAVVRPFSGQLTLNAEQLETLEQFWRDTGFGSVPFDWAHPRTNEPALVQFNNQQPPKPTARSGDHFKVPIAIEVLP